MFAPGVLGAPSYLRIGDAVAVFADVGGVKCLRGAKTPEEVTEADDWGRFVGNGVARMSREQLFGPVEVKGLAVEVAQKLLNASVALMDKAKFTVACFHFF